MRARELLGVTALTLLCAAGCKKNVPASNGSGLDSEGMSGTGRSTSEQPEGKSAEGTAPGAAELRAEGNDGGGRPVADLFGHKEPTDAGTRVHAGLLGPMDVPDGGVTSNVFGPGGLGTGGASNRPLLPPAKVGESVSRFEGCLASASPSEGDGATYPAQPPQTTARGGPPPSVLSVVPTGGGLVVEHKLNHACCLKGHLESAVSGNVVTLKEVLEGEPCRCLCSSTLRAAVAVAPGTYTVKVLVSERGAARPAVQTSVTVK